jgi:hypothetical protein
MPSAELEKRISTLADLSRTDLVERWQELYGCDPPKGTSMDFMVRAISSEMQAKHYGGLRPVVARRLNKIAGGVTEVAPKTLALNPGARLVREWNGATHTVDVTDDGFEWRGKVYGSLSAIAREITGAVWSGPRFFGLSRRIAS